MSGSGVASGAKGIYGEWHQRHMERHMERHMARTASMGIDAIYGTRWESNSNAASRSSKSDPSKIEGHLRILQIEFTNRN